MLNRCGHSLASVSAMVGRSPSWSSFCCALSRAACSSALHRSPASASRRLGGGRSVPVGPPTRLALWQAGVLFTLFALRVFLFPRFPVNLFGLPTNSHPATPVPALEYRSGDAVRVRRAAGVSSSPIRRPPEPCLGLGSGPLGLSPSGSPVRGPPASVLPSAEPPAAGARQHPERSGVPGRMDVQEASRPPPSAAQVR